MCTLTGCKQQRIVKILTVITLTSLFQSFYFLTISQQKYLYIEESEPERKKKQQTEKQTQKGREGNERITGNT